MGSFCICNLKNAKNNPCLYSLLSAGFCDTIMEILPTKRGYHMDQKQLQKYAELAVKTGVHLKEGQELVVQCSVDNADFCRMVVKCAYDAGASDVYVRWKDDPTARMRYEYTDISYFENPPEWASASYNYYARRHAGIINILSSDPEAFKGVDSAKILAATKASHEATREFDEIMDKNELQWNIVAVPSPSWAKKVFPDLPEEEAVEKLWAAIFTACRMNEENPVKAWETHSKTLAEKSAFLNQKQFVSLHYSNSLGTDFTVGLPKNHIWMGGGDRTVSGRDYFPNMPTEEVFTMPHMEQADGVVKSALPLSFQGSLIQNFSLTFQNGKVVDFSAEEGYDTLKRILDTDEGSRHLGEVALVPYDSPISNMKILFYNTLFDENASCHLALGACYPNTVKGGETLSKEELKQLGGNDSINHVDFMIGTADLRIVGREKDGTETIIFENGNWVV